ncbi:3-hydroxyacyl-CoA dehydrogenase family protein [Rhodococcus sp. D-46]|jgi:3-hydroxybutyryl-CoA dehydrogenase|uniref:3-hydroxyacyl-CoA dehydrogenase n=2 Tax=Rhodococcus erythropolis group TaxID=2840174 RepID=A0A5P3GFX1_RHOER|nr:MULTISPECIES: 3-hydroxyacyl-CoA dehydrogenase family protein [Rhodococcus]NHE63736.1 3-hydroxyacyl-CoA dehydrogenase family protein [Rhodococcus sp. D-46]ALU68688.1 3-hydroxybutyryl-CoA dehydrogenase [Rhodococcus erythropolis R138]ARE36473.1 3-hydroxybutyryl-CoA dehydrogenase [Rhodococcus sp. BH4]AUS34574.1 3-hydroxyacyl-CoA dehydrogenase family protein [Rhodococcus qingshengii]AZI64514.1 3-hydroxyacyl-CoA dehydrogenase family protein [Rhodococcus sp. NJ-530]
MTEAVAPKTVGVIGGGRMGAGIAQVFASLGGAVTIAESGDTAAALQRVSAGLDRAHERGKLDDQDPATVLARVSTVDAVTSLPPSLDLIVEAVPEIAALKVEVLAAAETVAGESTVIASNTSSMSIAELGAALTDPGRFIGMHFFNPVPASLLVEIVRAPQTRPEVVDSVRAWVSMLGKAEVLVNDSPGFATSRLGVGLGLEAIRMLEEGVADAESIDRAMELGYRHPMGPLRSTDLVGLDVRLAIAEHLASTLGDRFAPPALLREKVARGELGRKTGQGFHTWS